MKLRVNKEKAPAGSLAFVEDLKGSEKIEVTFTDNTELNTGGEVILRSDVSICRFLSKKIEANFYGSSLIEEAEVEHWLAFCSRLNCTSQFSDALEYLNTKIEPVAYLVGSRLTAADYAVWGALRGNGQWLQLMKGSKAPIQVARYYKFLLSRPSFSSVDKTLPQPETQTPKESKSKDEGSFVKLPGAEVGKVVVRFPPEASGYLHIGHAKAALLNQHYQQAFQGKLIMRFDDTNPAKENVEFEKVILEDVKLLGIKYDHFSYTSDHFEFMLTCCEKMLKNGKAFVDDTEPEQMKAEREQLQDSINRDNSPEKNMTMWREMLKGSEKGQKCCVRAKIDMKSGNGCLRDPTIYRCKTEEHPRTKRKYNVYPTYDFACPIVDSHEGVTHALRTTEYEDRNEQYHWVLDALGMRHPHIYSYSRLNLQNTVLSKRKLTWFVNSGIVKGWDDPRFPTVRGVLRRGMTVEGLKKFIVAQGSSRSVNMMEWDKIWSFNKKVIDPVVARYTALEEANRVLVNVNGVSDQCVDVQKHPKDADVGMKKVWRTSKVTIDGADAITLQQGEKVTFINWGNMIVKKINKAGDGTITSIDVDPVLSDEDYKKTAKITWLAETQKSPVVPLTVVHYDHIITKGILAKTDDFKDFVNKDSELVTQMVGETPLATLKKGDIIQLQRRGFFICDQPYVAPSANTCNATPCLLYNVPDGHSKQMPTSGSKHKLAQPASQPSKAKQDQKAPTSEVDTTAANSLDAKIREQGDIVRALKAEKKPKSDIDAAVKVLLSLKADFKSAVGADWKPDYKPPTPSKVTFSLPSESPVDLVKLDASVREQGDLVRKLKADKAPKPDIDAAVKELLARKATFKSAVGKDWKPDYKPPAATSSSGGSGATDAAALDASIRQQGDLVRKLKAEKATKPDIDSAVKELLARKATFKSAVGKDWKPDYKPPAATSASGSSGGSGSADAGALDASIRQQGDLVRKLKSEKAPKNEIDAAVKVLLARKADFKTTIGQDWKPDYKPPAATLSQTTAATDRM